MRYLATFFIGTFLAGLGVLAAGWSPSQPDDVGETPMTVQVSYVVERDVTDYSDFTGRTAAMDAIEVRARVWGYIDEFKFKEGTLVNKGTCCSRSTRALTRRPWIRRTASSRRSRPGGSDWMLTLPAPNA